MEGLFKDWKSKIDECCADELEEMIIDSIKAGFLSKDEILEDCTEYIEDNYPDDCEGITDRELLKIIEQLCKEFQNTGDQETFFKLDAAFRNLAKQGIVALHYAGYTQSEGFEECNEIASELHEKKENVIGCCFYSEQDLGHILHGDSTLLYLSFGNYFDKPTAEEVGQMIVKELEKSGFHVQWDGTSAKKIAIEDLKWDKFYNVR